MASWPGKNRPARRTGPSRSKARDGEVSPELAYIHDTLLEAMAALRDPNV